MAGDNQHGYITFGWIATICYLILFAAVNDSKNATVNQSSYYQQKCAAQYPDSPFATAPFIARFDQREVDERNNELGNIPDWCDLTAQQRMAEDTSSMRRAAWFGFFSGVAGISLLIWTLVENRRVAEAAIQANNIQDSLFEAETRPLIGFINTDSIGLCCKSNNLIARFNIKNYGKSFASNVRIYMDTFNPTALVASTVTSKEFAQRKIGRIGTEPQMILPQQDRDFCVVARIPKQEEMIAGWIVHLCVTYQREGGVKTYYTSAQIVVTKDNATAVYSAEGTVENIPCRYARESEVAV